MSLLQKYICENYGKICYNRFNYLTNNNRNKGQLSAFEKIPEDVLQKIFEFLDDFYHDMENDMRDVRSLRCSSRHFNISLLPMVINSLKAKKKDFMERACIVAFQAFYNKSPCVLKNPLSDWSALDLENAKIVLCMNPDKYKVQQYTFEITSGILISNTGEDSGENYLLAHGPCYNNVLRRHICIPACSKRKGQRADVVYGSNIYKRRKVQDGFIDIGMSKLDTTPEKMSRVTHYVHCKDGSWCIERRNRSGNVKNSQLPIRYQTLANKFIDSCKLKTHMQYPLTIACNLVLQTQMKLNILEMCSDKNCKCCKNIFNKKSTFVPDFKDKLKFLCVLWSRQKSRIKYLER